MTYKYAVVINFSADLTDPHTAPLPSAVVLVAADKEFQVYRTNGPGQTLMHPLAVLKALQAAVGSSLDAEGVVDAIRATYNGNHHVAQVYTLGAGKERELISGLEAGQDLLNDALALAKAECRNLTSAGGRHLALIEDLEQRLNRAERLAATYKAELEAWYVGCARRTPDE